MELVGYLTLSMAKTGVEIAQNFTWTSTTVAINLLRLINEKSKV